MNITCCRDCPRKGCGSYHDICPEYKAQKDEIEKAKKAEKQALNPILTRGQFLGNAKGKRRNKFQ